MKITLENQTKQPYTPPHFERYGNISQLTQTAQSVKGGNKADGANAPNTKV